MGWCEQQGVVCQAYCPLIRGQRLEEKVLRPIMKRTGKTAAQVLMRWSLQKVSSNACCWFSAG